MRTPSLRGAAYLVAAFVVILLAPARAEEIPIDNFDSYVDSMDLRSPQVAGTDWNIGGAALLALETATGRFGKSMKLYYDTTFPFFGPSAARLTWDLPQNWSGAAARQNSYISLWLSGNIANYAEEVFVQLVDLAGNQSTVRLSDTTLVTAANWNQLTLPLDDFAAQGIEFEDIKTFAVGLGKNPLAAGGLGMICIDDIAIVLPEPMTMSLFSLAGILLLAHRKRAVTRQK